MVRVVFSEMAPAGLQREMPDEGKRNGLKEGLKFYLKREIPKRRFFHSDDSRPRWVSPYWNDLRVVWEEDVGSETIYVWIVGKLSPYDPDRFSS
jgi:hypothetical protein